ncbi:MAG TPA: macrolide 2'-phosphotransferase [Candidatus Salinicoccus stercoripullorum]|uniref:Macrolide 2'-phosphotransferase n=1 Tax=Candidatus Salinicoccus stercoripullorum TaxID=2838756 RepID=A0A9D1TYG8_9STAP|nr:macrolide 2'-phosphotransferase [Candidatus Salinicoccus stercoripullorum]
MGRTMGEVVGLASSHGLELNPKNLVENNSGLDFQVVFGSDKEDRNWVLRIPRREDVFVRTKPEKRALDLIVRNVDFEVPVWEIYEKDLIAYQSLTGVLAGTIDPAIQNYIFEIDNQNLPENFTRTLAETMVDLHSISLDEAREAGIEAIGPGDLRGNMKERMLKVKDRFGVSEALWDRWMKWVETDGLWPKETGMIHGDLHPGHIMVDSESNVKGLIDWTEAKVSDISKDFMGHYRVFGEEGLDNLIEAYKAAGGYHWPGMKEHMIELMTSFSVDIAEFAMESGMEEYEKMARKELGV